MTTTEQKLTLARDALEEIKRDPDHFTVIDIATETLAAIATESAPAATNEACKCTFSQRMVGDGCSVCNPEYAKRFADDESAPAAGAPKYKWSDDGKTVTFLNANEMPSYAQARAGAASIDTPEFAAALRKYYDSVQGRGFPTAVAELIDHINAWGAQQREAGRRDMHETNMALLDENMKLRERAEKAEAQLKELHDVAWAAKDKLAARLAVDLSGLEIAYRHHYPEGKREAVWLDEVQALLSQDKPAALAQRAAGETNCEVVGGDANHGTINVRVDGRPNWSQFPLGGRAYLAARAVGGVDVDGDGNA